MSRIHDALLKAEQERQAGKPADISPSSMLEGISAVEPVLPGPEAVVMPTSVGITAVGAAEPGQISFEELRSRCLKRAWKLDVKKVLFADGNSAAVGAEEFRTLRSRLYQMRGSRTVSKVLISSALPGEGKTYVAANLAHTLARQRGRRVLLVDADIRLPRLSKLMGAPNSPGLSNYLKGDATEFDVIQQGPNENLMFLPGGSPVANPSELISGSGIATLLARVGEAFDWVIVDSPAAVPISDASVIANSVDGVLLVVASASTPFDLARKIRQEFPEQNLLGVVLNRVNRRSVYSSYYYGYYGTEAASPGAQSDAS